MKKHSMILLIVAALVFWGTSANANLIVNGSFENLPTTLSNGGWTTYTAIEGWTASTGSIEVRNSVAGVAQDGNVFVEMDAYFNSTMYSQSVLTTIGQEYALSYYYAPRENVAATSNGIDLYFNNQLLDSYTSFSSSNNAWTQRIFTVTGTGNDVITFLASGTSDSYGGSIDNVVMETKSVPEPSTLLLLGFGLFGLVGYKRKFSTK